MFFLLLVLIASASGIGVALSVLGDYVATVVGVAISASLLPPAVNTGIFLSFAIFDEGWEDHLHSAGVSLLLTIENIILIYLTSLGMFYIKDVLPVQHRGEFFHALPSAAFRKRKEDNNEASHAMSPRRLRGVPYLCLTYFFLFVWFLFFIFYFLVFGCFGFVPAFFVCCFVLVC